MIELTNDMLVNIPKIDAQHKELVKMLNTAQSMGMSAFSAAETKKTLDFLGNYVAQHFSDEEALQRQSNYPKYSWHKEQHKIFVDEFMKLKKEFAVNGASSRYTLNLNKSIIGWIVRHIKSADTEFGRYYSTKRQ